jgi:DNA invertase Pin-like site-specific DNA recombinase
VTVTTETPTAAAIYARISQDRTGQGLGVGRQEGDCREWAARHGWTVAEVYIDDDVSAYSGKTRPGYRRMLAAFEAGERDGLVVWHPDRLHRSPAELEDFIALVERTGLHIGTVTAGDVDLTSATGRMTARIVGAVARHESDHKAERIRRKHLELAQNGRVPGGGRRPFGYESDRVTLRESEAELIREAAARVLAGDGLRTIAADWTARGITTVTGARWQATTLGRMLHSGRIAGWREHHGQLVAQAVWPAIISAEDSRKLRRLLDDPTRRLSDTQARSYLLSGMVTCGRCGARMTAAPVMRKGHRYRRYACLKDRGGCNRCGIGAQPLEDLIVQEVLAAIDTPALAATVAERESAVPTGQVEEIEGRLAELAEMFAAGEIGRAEWSRARQGLAQRLDEARGSEAGAVRQTITSDLLAGVAADTWPAMSLDQKRAVISTVLESITISPTTKAGNKFDPDRIDLRWKV